jgi:hypothetical protein
VHGGPPDFAGMTVHHCPEIIRNDRWPQRDQTIPAFS